MFIIALDTLRLKMGIRQCWQQKNSQKEVEFYLVMLVQLRARARLHCFEKTKQKHKIVVLDLMGVKAHKMGLMLGIIICMQIKGGGNSIMKSRVARRLEIKIATNF